MASRACLRLVRELKKWLWEKEAAKENPWSNYSDREIEDHIRRLRRKLGTYCDSLEFEYDDDDDYNDDDYDY